MQVTRPGSSPHTRGARRRRRGKSAATRIIPAYAGSTPTRQRPSGSPRDHPRIRGEHLLTVSCRSPREGSSPHTRGARGRARVYPISSRIIPAYAGSTALQPPRARRRRDHPRIRGEHRHNSWTNPLARGSSPHTRGARARPAQELAIERIIPAYAGSTPSQALRIDPRGDHPRIRGEHCSTSTR